MRLLPPPTLSPLLSISPSIYDPTTRSVHDPIKSPRSRTPSYPPSIFLHRIFVPISGIPRSRSWSHSHSHHTSQADLFWFFPVHPRFRLTSFETSITIIATPYVPYITLLPFCAIAVNWLPSLVCPLHFLVFLWLLVHSSSKGGSPNQLSHTFS